MLLNYHRSREAAEELERELTARGADVMAYGADVSDREQVERMAAACERRFGGADVLVCNAGIARQGLFTDLTPQEWREMMGVHVDGAFHCCRGRSCPGMIRKKEGSIVLVSSVWGLTGASCEVAYSTAKAALIGMTKALAKEVGPSGIRVNCVAPGVVDTAMNAALDGETLASLREETPLGRLGTPRGDRADDRLPRFAGSVLYHRTGAQPERWVCNLKKSRCGPVCFSSFLKFR